MDHPVCRVLRGVAVMDSNCPGIDTEVVVAPSNVEDQKEAACASSNRKGNRMAKRARHMPHKGSRV